MVFILVILTVEFKILSTRFRSSYLSFSSKKYFILIIATDSRISEQKIGGALKISLDGVTSSFRLIVV